MMQRFEYKGLWFLPEEADNKIEGTLIYIPNDKIYLELTGSFENLSSDLGGHEIILGFTTNGKYITLLRCYETSKTMSFPGIPTTKYSVHFIIEGTHFNKIIDINFYKLRASIANFEEWVNIWGFNISMDTKTRELTTTFKIPPKISFDINEKLKGEFRFSYSPGLVPTPNYKIEQRTKLDLIAKDETNYKDFLIFLEQFKNFITLGVFQEVYVKDIEFYSKTILENFNDKEQYESPIKFYFIHKSLNKNVDSRHFNDFLFNYKKIEQNFEKIIQKWFDLYVDLSPVLNVLFETFSNRGTFNENNFLNIVQALEIYHRRIKEDKDKLVGQFNEIIEPILSKLNEKETEWLTEKLEYSYEPNLRKRLKELFDEFNINPLIKVIGSKNKLKRLIHKTTVSRNYFTHYNSDLKEEALQGEDLFYLTEKLKILLIILILREAGFEKDEIENLFSSHEYRYFNHIMRTNSY